MTITPHLLAGSALASATTNNIAIAFLIGFFLHFILDAIPHVDPGTFTMEIEIPEINVDIDLLKTQDKKPWPLWVYIYSVLEFIVIWTIVIILFWHKSNFDIIVAGGFGGIFVDILENNPLRVMRTWPVLKQIQWLHEKVHYNLPAKKWYWGILTQLVVVGLSLWFLLKK